MILVHPVAAGRADAMHEFLPCTYGCATTVRRAQGASLDYVCLYFDHYKAPGRGYGYVGAGRCRNATGLYYFGRLRRTDWLPIGGGDPDEESQRGSASEAETVDPYDGRCGDGTESDCNTLRSYGHLQPSSDEDDEFDEDGNYREIDEDYSPSSDEDSEFDEDGNYREIDEDSSAIGQGDVSFTCGTEPQDAYGELFAKRRKTAE